MLLRCPSLCLAVLGAAALNTILVQAAPGTWKVGTPIVTYWCGPPMTDATASQLADGGFNLVWCTEKELAVAQNHGLRAMLTDPLLSPATLDQPAQREKLDALIERVKHHPALSVYFITDEPNTAQFAGLGRLVSYLRERDPAHLAYINLFPTYATNDQLGTKGDTVTAYKEYVDQYVQTVRPGLLSYDHYQFNTSGDSADYFLNLGIIRQSALDAKIPFLNIVQASSWAASVRVPGPDELRYLVNTTLAYGAEGISYYIYCCPNHRGGFANADGSPTELYAPVKTFNREFVAVASELQRLTSLGVYHAGMLPPGTEPLPAKASFSFEPPLAPMKYAPPERVRGALIGLFGPAPKPGKKPKPTHAFVVSLDYKSSLTVGVKGPKRLELFDSESRTWVASKQRVAQVQLLPGGGQLLRIKGR